MSNSNVNDLKLAIGKVGLTPQALANLTKFKLLNKMSTVLTMYEQVFNYIEDDTTTLTDAVFVDELGVGFKSIDIKTSIDTDGMIIGSDGRSYPLEYVLSALSDQRLKTMSISAILEGASKTTNFSDLKLYVDAFVGAAEANSAASALWVDFTDTAGAYINQGMTMAQSALSWVRSLLTKASAASLVSGYFIDVEDDYSGKSVASIFLSTLDIDLTGAWDFIISTTKAILTGIVGSILRISDFISDSVSNFIKAGSATAYVQINDSSLINSFDYPSCQVKFDSLTQIDQWMTDIFPIYNESTSQWESKHLSDFISKHFSITLPEFYAFLDSTSEGFGFELPTNFGYLQFFHLTGSQWCFRIMIAPTHELAIPQIGGGYNYRPQKVTTTLIDDELLYREKSLRYTWGQYLDAVFDQDSALRPSAITGKYEASTFYEGVRASFIRMNVFLGALIGQFGMPFSKLYFTGPINNYGADSSIAAYQECSICEQLFGCVTGSGFKGAFDSNTENAGPINPTNADMITMLTVFTDSGEVVDYSTLSYSKQSMIAYMLKKFLALSAFSVLPMTVYDDSIIAISVPGVMTVGPTRYTLFTDTQAVARFTGMLKGIATVAALTAVVVLSLLAFKKLRVTQLRYASMAQSAFRDMGSYALSGDLSGYSSALSTFRFNNRRTKLLGLLVGGSSALASYTSSTLAGTVIPIPDVVEPLTDTIVNTSANVKTDLDLAIAKVAYLINPTPFD